MLACTYCDSGTSQQACWAFFNETFWSNAVLSVAPVPILAAVVALIYFGLPRYQLTASAGTSHNAVSDQWQLQPPIDN
jgi:hypothetical protein